MQTIGRMLRQRATTVSPPAYMTSVAPMQGSNAA